jgi:hypothetical protein
MKRTRRNPVTPPGDLADRAGALALLGRDAEARVLAGLVPPVVSIRY